MYLFAPHCFLEFFFISHLWFSMDIHVFHWRENSFPEFEWFLLLNLHPSEVSTICHIVEFGVKFFRISYFLKELEYKMQSLNVGVNHVSFNSNCRNLDLLHIQIGVDLFKVSQFFGFSTGYWPWACQYIVLLIIIGSLSMTICKNIYFF